MAGMSDLYSTSSDDENPDNLQNNNFPPSSGNTYPSSSDCEDPKQTPNPDEYSSSSDSEAQRNSKPLALGHGKHPTNEGDETETSTDEPAAHTYRGAPEGFVGTRFYKFDDVEKGKPEDIAECFNAVWKSKEGVVMTQGDDVELKLRGEPETIHATLVKLYKEKFGKRANKVLISSPPLVTIRLLLLCVRVRLASILTHFIFFLAS